MEGGRHAVFNSIVYIAAYVGGRGASDGGATVGWFLERLARGRIGSRRAAGVLEILLGKSGVFGGIPQVVDIHIPQIGAASG